MKNIFLLAACLLASLVANAQSKGLVLDKDQQPIPNVNVLLVEQNLLLHSNEEGEFFIDEHTPENSYIQFYKQGYATTVKQYKKQANITVVLDKLHVDLDEVGVVDSYHQLGNSKLISIEKKSLDNNFLEHNSLAESLTQINGVYLLGSGLGIQKVVVRGLSGMRVVTYLNGMKIENQQWANDHGMGFSSLGLHEVELIKGSAALQYGGEAVGGLLYFKDKPFVSGEKPKAFIASQFNSNSYLMSNQLGMKWNKNSFHFNLFAHHSISSDYRLPNKTYLYNSRFRNSGLKLSIAKRYNYWQHIFRYQYNGEQTGIPAHSHSNPDKVILADITLNNLHFSEDFKVTRPTQFVNNHLLIYESSYFKNAHKLSLHLAHFINQLEEYEKWTVPAFDMSLSNTQFKPNYRYQKDGLTLNIGSQLSHLNNFNNVEHRLIPDASTNMLGLYSILDYEKDIVGISAGVRYDYKQIDCEAAEFTKNFNNLSFSSGVYSSFRNHLLRLTYSTAFRAPHFAELFSNGVHHGSIRYEVGNPDLSLEKSHQFDLKYQFSSEHFGLVVNPFLQHINNFIGIEASDSLYNSAYRIYHYTNYDKVLLSGLEMNLHYHPHLLHNLHIEQSYSFLQNKKADEHLSLTPANKMKTKALLQFYHYQRLYKYSLRSISIGHTYAFQKTDVAVGEEVTDAYQLLELQLNFEVGKRFELVCSIDNLLNETYVPHISRLRKIAGGVPNPGRSISLRMKYEF